MKRVRLTVVCAVFFALLSTGTAVLAASPSAAPPTTSSTNSRGNHVPNPKWTVTPPKTRGASPNILSGLCTGEVHAYNVGDMRVSSFARQDCSGTLAVSQELILTLYKCGQTWFGGCQFRSQIEPLGDCQQPGPTAFSCPADGLAYSSYLDHGSYQVTCRHIIFFSDGYYSDDTSDSEVVTI